MGVDFAVDSCSNKKVNYKIANHYSPSTPGIYHLLKKMPIVNSDRIIDIGCGKGKAMYFMSKFPFAEIAGFDISEELCSIAKKNLEILNVSNSHVFYENANTFAEYDNYNYFYIYNSVPTPVFVNVLNHIIDSLSREKRLIYIICLNPVYHHIIMNTQKFYVYKKYTSLHKSLSVKCYSNIE